MLRLRTKGDNNEKGTDKARQKASSKYLGGAWIASVRPMGAYIFRRVFSFTVLLAFTVGLASPAHAALHEKCIGVGQTSVSSGRIYTCTVAAGKISWNKGVQLSAKLSKTPEPKIQGLAQVGQTLEALTGTWDTGVVLEFQWLKNTKPISGATDQSYVPVAGDLGSKISVRVLGAKALHMPASEISKETSRVIRSKSSTGQTSLEKNFTNPTAPTIAQVPIVGSTLWAKRGSWAAQGVTYKYQWLSDGQIIAGAIKPTYLLRQIDSGKQLAVTVTGEAKGYKKTTLVSNYLLVKSNLKRLPVANRDQIKGAAVLGETLTISSPWKQGMDVQYQWLRDGIPIKTATTQKYKLSALDDGKYISVRFSSIEPGYFQEVVDSLPIGPVTKTQLLKFTTIGTLAVDGALTLGGTLTARSNGWESDVALSIRWLRDGTLIEGQTTSSYFIQDIDKDRTISAVVTAQKNLYEPMDVIEVAGKVVIKNFTNAPTPLIEGTNRTGSVLSVSSSSLNWSQPAELAYQWLRNGQVIAGATSFSYTVAEFDLGSVISVTVTGRAIGYNSVSKMSSSSEPITASQISGSQPVISGTAELDQTLTLAEGSWDAGTTLAYQWFANGSPITGETAKSLRLTNSQVGKIITVQTVGSKSGFPDLVKTSSATATVTQNEFIEAPTPTIAGNPIVGGVLSAAAGLWSPSANITYQWLKDGLAILGANTSTFSVSQTEVGSRLSVEVKGSKTGFGTTSKLSAQILIIAPPKAPIVTSKFGRISSIDIGWAAESVANYTFNVVNGAGLSVGSYSCASATCQSTFTISGFPTNSAEIQYTLNYSVTNEGGTVSGSTTVSTYPKQTLSVSMTSIVRTGDQYVFNFPSTSNWTYQFNNYGVYDNSNCGVMSASYTSSPLTVYLPKGTCTMEFLLTDGRGNANSVVIPGNITQVVAPAPVLAGTLSATSVTASDAVDYTLTYSSYYPYYTYNLVILNSSGALVTPATAPTASRSGDSWSGSKSGKIFFTGFAPGAYTVRADFKSTSDVRYGYDQQASVTLGVVTVG